MPTQRFSFAFAPAHRLAAVPFAVLPSTAWVEVDPSRLRARFGVWTLDTPRSNIEDVTVTGGYSFFRTAGPAHLSLTDHGVTFATNDERGVCVLFREPVKVLDPIGLLRHPGATFTVADPDALVAALAA
ncbi:MAG: hypothetical protein ACJ710_13630 [Ornithinibacter sp.]